MKIIIKIDRVTSSVYIIYIYIGKIHCDLTNYRWEYENKEMTNTVHNTDSLDRMRSTEGKTSNVTFDRYPLLLYFVLLFVIVTRYLFFERLNDWANNVTHGMNEKKGCFSNFHIIPCRTTQQVTTIIIILSRCYSCQL